eukprot:scaffold122213_cov32-Tisochrysis_lutea.AAC.4
MTELGTPRKRANDSKAETACTVIPSRAYRERAYNPRNVTANPRSRRIEENVVAQHVHLLFHLRWRHARDIRSATLPTGDTPPPLPPIHTRAHVFRDRLLTGGQCEHAAPERTLYRKSSKAPRTEKNSPAACSERKKPRKIAAMA